MLYNYAKLGYDITGTDNLDDFEDGDEISDWAEAKMKQAPTAY